MANYYNDNDKKVCNWLKALIEAKLIPYGDVDDRSIVDVRPEDLREYSQCHFFAGIGGWSLALELVGWPAERPVWTGSCPCQPFSAAGKHKGADDERHLWPEFRRLIAECHPPVVFGEQVASKDGREWLAGVRADLEGVGYAVGAADLCAASVGAPHIRQRLYWVADSVGTGLEGHGRDVADGNEPGRYGTDTSGSTAASGIDSGWVADSENTNGRRTREASVNGRRFEEAGRSGTTSFWDDAVLIPCRDPKRGTVYRRAPAEPAFQPLAYGLPGRVVQLRGLGNAIVPQIAAEFIKAFLDCPSI